MAPLPLLPLFFILALLSPPLPSASAAHRCFPAIFSFGDSLADTGNAAIAAPSPASYPSAHLPYGETYFHRPTGRFSDGRLFVDFVAKGLQLPYLNPSLDNDSDSRNGLNFAFAGATALGGPLLIARNITEISTSVSLNDEIRWFKKYKRGALQATPLADSKTSHHNSMDLVFKDALYLMGEIGGNDINYAFVSGKSINETLSYFPLIMIKVREALEDLLREGARTILVQGQLPFGCSPSYLTAKPGNPQDYDSLGCLKAFNGVADLFNNMLTKMLQELREINPDVAIIYFDYSAAYLDVLRHPSKYGITTTLRACCGFGGAYNFNPEVWCGQYRNVSGSLYKVEACKDPKKHVSWDGIHFTDALYRAVAKKLKKEGFTDPYPNILTEKCLHF